MAKELLSLDNGTTCSSWNYSDTRLATGSVDGTLSIFDLRDPTSSSSSLRSTFKTKVNLIFNYFFLLIKLSLLMNALILVNVRLHKLFFSPYFKGLFGLIRAFLD
jgi:WD40 repeat protein